MGIVWLHFSYQNLPKDFFELFNKVIDGYLQCLQRQNTTILAAASYVSQVVMRRGSTRRTGSGVNFDNIKIILFPVNMSGSHWTLFVSVPHCKISLSY